MKLTDKKGTNEHSENSLPAGRYDLFSGAKELSAEHEHGGNVYKMSEELGISEDKLIDFSASINPLGISERVKDVIAGSLDSLVHYPDSDTKKLREKLAAHHGIDPESILCGNGSTELIYLLPRALKPRTVIIPVPTFSEYERACMMVKGAKVEHYLTAEENGYNVNTDEFSRDLQGCDMAFLCNPNNPTGNIMKRDDILELAKAAAKAQCMLVIDEAFIDFDPRESVIHDLESYPRLIVLRSMTKFYALTGLRAGYAVAHRDTVARLKQYKEPWTVNSLAQKAAVAALEDRDYMKRTMDVIVKEKAYLEKSFRELGLQHYPSAANYYLLRKDGARGHVEALRKRGLLLRDCSNFKGLDETYMRIAVKSHKENKMLIKHLKDICRA